MPSKSLVLPSGSLLGSSWNTLCTLLGSMWTFLCSGRIRGLPGPFFCVRGSPFLVFVASGGVFVGLDLIDRNIYIYILCNIIINIPVYL